MVIDGTLKEFCYFEEGLKGTHLILKYLESI
jgi:hypothetical protein